MEEINGTRLEGFKIKWWQNLLLLGLIACDAWAISKETKTKEIIFAIEFLIVLVAVFIGRWLNFIAVYLNGNRMPVFYFMFQVMNLKVKTIKEVKDDGVHSVLDRNTKVKFFCDIIPVVTFGLDGKVEWGMASIGDLIQFFATFFMLVIFLRYLIF